MLQLRIDPWAASYEGAYQLGEEPPLAKANVDLTSEVQDPSGWRPIDPQFVEAPETAVFIDGVQRVELRVIGDENGQTVFGAFSSVAVGAAVMRRGGSDVQPELTRRVIALNGGATCEPWEVPCGTADLSFLAESVPDTSIDAWQNAVRNVRREAEKALGARMVEAGHPLVIVDGRLDFPPRRGSHAIGVAKSIRTLYLERPHSDILRDLRPATRTPIFAIQYEHPVFSWYVRLTRPRAFEHDWAGIVQVETWAGIGIEAAVRLADLTTCHLPSYASTPEWDSRAPQNLFPIAALENHLRHEMGDPEWIRRNLEAHFHRIGGLS